VSSQLTPTAGPDQEVRTELEDLIRDFDRNPPANAKRIRELLEMHRRSFYRAAIDLLRDPGDSRGIQYLINALVTVNLFPRVLADEGLSYRQALAVARTATQVNPMVDVALARHLSEMVTTGDAPPGYLQRLMGILSEISNGTRIVPSLMTLARQSNPHLQSKAVLMIGKANHSIKWLQTRLTMPDPRIRANAVESLWGVDTDEVRELLRKTARDGNNRVAGNALLGLYRLGDSSVILAMLGMAEHASKQFRATAAWVMGQTGDPRFTKALGRLLAQHHAAIRARAFAALGQIRAATALATQGNRWRVAARLEQPVLNGWRQLQVEISSVDGTQQIRLLPTQFILVEGGQPVIRYAVEERPYREPLSVAFLFPRPADPESAPFVRGAIGALRYKRPSDLWTVLPFLATRREVQTTPGSETASLESEGGGGDPPLQYTSNAENLPAHFHKMPSKMDCGEIWGALRRAVQVEGGPARGQRHVIVYSERESLQSPRYAEVASEARAAKVAVHAIALAANPLLEDLCKATQGTFETVAGEEWVADAVEQTCLNLMARYTIRYEPVSSTAETLRLRVQSREGWGEAEIAIPPQQSAM
jgi:hypothetical protein